MPQAIRVHEAGGPDVLKWEDVEVGEPEGGQVKIRQEAGGVGLIMCQWAASLGATVIGTVGTEEKAELARNHGCHHPIVYSKQDFVAEVNRITGGEKLPVVYDGVGRTTFLKSLDCLKV